MKSNIFLAKYKKVKYIPIICLSIIINFFLKYFYKKKIVLVGGHCGEKYQDNASSIHKYLQNHVKNIDLYWMINNREVSYRNEVGKNAVIGSLKGYLLYLNASVCYFSHSLDSDIAPVIDKLLFKNWKPIRVHISHGVEGLKRNIYSSKIENVDFYVCNSHLEKKIKNEEWMLENDKLIITGVPRHDYLIHKINEKTEKIILYMPTWRDWQYNLDDKEFIESNFFTSVMSLINSEQIIRLLNKNDYKLEILLHPFIQNRVENFNLLDVSSRITLLDVNQDISQKITEADLLITDYSSVCWDFLFLLKPVIFFQFDQLKYMQERGSYIDLNKDLFGKVVFNENELVDALEEELNIKKEIRKKKLIKYRNHYFEYLDGKNCERTIDFTLYSKK